MICKRYWALKDSHGFPTPGTQRGYDIDPCKCELVELKAVPDEPEVGDVQRFHPGGLHFFYQLDRECGVLPNSLIASKQFPSGRYVEFKLYSPSS